MATSKIDATQYFNKLCFFKGIERVKICEWKQNELVNARKNVLGALVHQPQSMKWRNTELDTAALKIVQDKEACSAWQE